METVCRSYRGWPRILVGESQSPWVKMADISTADNGGALVTNPYDISVDPDWASMAKSVEEGGRLLLNNEGNKGLEVMLLFNDVLGSARLQVWSFDWKAVNHYRALTTPADRATLVEVPSKSDMYLGIPVNRTREIDATNGYVDITATTDLVKIKFPTFVERGANVFSNSATPLPIPLSTAQALYAGVFKMFDVRGCYASMVTIPVITTATRVVALGRYV